MEYTYYFHSQFTSCMALVTGWWHSKSTISRSAKSLMKKLSIETFGELDASHDAWMVARRKVSHSLTSFHVDRVSITQGMNNCRHQLWVMWHHMSHWERHVAVSEVQLWTEILRKPAIDTPHGMHRYHPSFRVLFLIAPQLHNLVALYGGFIKWGWGKGTSPTPP